MGKHKVSAIGEISSGKGLPADWERKIDDVNEPKHIDNLELLSSIIKERNDRANESKWYGARLQFLMHFYSKNLSEVAYACKTHRTNVSYWVNNIKHPNLKQFKGPDDKQLARLCFFFEIPASYFTEPIVDIRITEQQRIDVIVRKDD